MKHPVPLLRTRQDYFDLFKKINQPLQPFYRASGAQIDYIHQGVGYGNKIAGMEGFSRVLWGAGPAIDQLDERWLKLILSGIKAGTDPSHPDYWGEIHERDQRMVEMPAMLLALYHHEQLLWKKLDTGEKSQIIHWFSQIFEYECADGNWQFFKIIVGTIIQKFGYPVKESALKEAFDNIENCYLQNGWYRDSSRGRQDYYNPFAFHYYGLIYSVLEPEKPISQIYKNRAIDFSRDYIHFFAEDGANVPFGRSMIYRFAVSSFWSAMLWADLLPFKLGEIKGLVNRNIRWWMQKEIFDEKGILNIGYTYPQLTLTEPYNSTLSPLWLNKIFLLLALPEDHEYWTAKEMPMPILEGTKLLSEANLLIQHDNGHTFFLNAGQLGPNFHTLTNEKYLKFAYSSQFGFSIPRANQLKAEMAMDSMLGIQRADTYITTSFKNESIKTYGQFIVRNNVRDIVCKKEVLASTWEPTLQAKIRTWLIPFEGWQIRVHKVELDTEYVLYETGFAIECSPEKEGIIIEEDKENYRVSEAGFSGIICLSDDTIKRKSTAIMGLPNTNLMTWENTFIPGLEGTFGKGTHWLGTGVVAHQDRDYSLEVWNNRPKIDFDGTTGLTIQNKNNKKRLKLC
ncbi:TPA: DUF2264 domain-containing protein [Enterococcus faecium]